PGDATGQGRTLQCPELGTRQTDTPRRSRPTDARSVFGRLSEPAHVLTPLDGHHALLANVAVLAGRHDVAANALAAAAERHDVIHRERARLDGALAVIAPPRAHATLPPLTLAELTRAGALAPELVGIDRRVVLSHAPPAHRSV